ncbi:hypothetical protein V6N13_016146 [Hibiscus sabdariffa]
MSPPLHLCLVSHDRAFAFDSFVRGVIEPLESMLPQTMCVELPLPSSFSAATAIILLCRYCRFRVLETQAAKGETLRCWAA